MRPLTMLAAAVLCGLTFMVLPGTAAAGDYEVTPLLGYAFGGGFENAESGDSLDLGDGGNFGLILGMADKTRSGAFYELFYSHQETHLHGDGVVFSGEPRMDIKIDYLHLGGSYYPTAMEQQRLMPFVSGGLGLTYLSPEQGDSETRFSLSLGGGLRLQLSEHLGLRLEGRGFGTLFNGSGSAFCESGNACRVQVKGDLFWQFNALVGLVFSF